MFATAAILGVAAAANDSIPGADQAQPIALIGGDVYTVNGPVIEGGTVLFDKGRIVAVGKKVDIPKDALRMILDGRRVYPGLIAASTNLGLIEIGAVRATRDISETGTINPNVLAETAVNPDSELIPVTRSNGVLMALTMPGGGLISGKSAVIKLDGWTWEDMTLQSAAALHIHWPNMSAVEAWWQEESKKEQIDERDERIKALRRAFDDARAYLKAKTAHAAGKAPAIDSDARWEAMLPVLEGTTPVIVHADRNAQIQAAVAFAVEQKIKLIILGGYDAPQCAELLKKHNIPVIVSAVYRLPMRRSEPYDTPFTLPERLRKSGIKFCIAGGNRFATANSRNLPYHAAMAVGFGLPQDEALRSVTLSAAEILGIADRVGSLEVGKDATLFIANGDILETPTQVEFAFIQGRQVDLSDRHKRLWKKYQEKYRRQDAAAD
jgi:imidazolonepropionase-like amidohydrolase